MRVEDPLSCESTGRLCLSARSQRKVVRLHVPDSAEGAAGFSETSKHLRFIHDDTPTGSRQSPGNRQSSSATSCTSDYNEAPQVNKKFVWTGRC